MIEIEGEKLGLHISPLIFQSPSLSLKRTPFAVTFLLGLVRTMKWVEDSQENGGLNDGSKKKKGGSKAGSQKAGSNDGSKKKKGGSKAGSQKKVGEKASGSGKDSKNDNIPDNNVSK